MKKRLLSMILALSMLLTFLPAGALPAFAASDPTASDGTYSYSYNENADGTLTITAFLGTANELDYHDYTVTVPTELAGKQVTAIGQYAFANNYGYLRDDGTFFKIVNQENNNLIQKVIIPDGILSIGEYAFFSNNSLKEVSIAGSVKKIKPSAFQDCKALKTLALNPGLEEIGDKAFYDCTSLSTSPEEPFVLPDGLVSIGELAFYNCASLTNVTIPGSVKKISDRAFCMCTNLKKVTLSSGITSTGTSMFYACTSLTTVELPKTLTTIETDTFERCSSLNHVTIPASVTSIGTCAFSICSSLSDLTFAPNSALASIEEGAFKSCSALESIDLPANLHSIGEDAFRISGLTSITLPESITTIGANAFNGCESLASATIWGNLTALPEGIFKFDTALKQLTLPATLTSIGSDALGRCYLGYAASPSGYYGAIYYNGNKTGAEALINNSNGELQNRKVVYRCNVNFRTQDGELIKTVPVYSTMDVKPEDIPVDSTGTASTWYLNKEMTQSFDPAHTNEQITDDLDLYTTWTASVKTGSLTVTNGSFTYEKPDGEEITGKTGEIPVGTLVTVTFDKGGFADSSLTFDHWDIKGLKDPNAYNKMEKFSFEMPAFTVTMEAMTRDASIEDNSDFLGTAAIIGTAVVGGAILAYQGHQLGTELYLTYLLPSGAVIPANRIQLALLLWQDAGNPVPVDEPAYSDLDADDTDAQSAAQWAVETGLMELPDPDNAPDQFDPYAAVSTVEVIHAWKNAQKMKG